MFVLKTIKPITLKTECNVIQFKYMCYPHLPLSSKWLVIKKITILFTIIITVILTDIYIYIYIFLYSLRLCLIRGINPTVQILCMYCASLLVMNIYMMHTHNHLFNL